MGTRREPPGERAGIATFTSVHSSGNIDYCRGSEMEPLPEPNNERSHASPDKQSLRLRGDPWLPEVAGIINELYARFVETLPSTHAAVAARLPYLLGMTPVPWTRWSDVYADTVLLGLPLGFVPEGCSARVQTLALDAASAHLLGVAAGFIQQRVHEQRLAANSNLTELLPLLTAARDEALGRVASQPPNAGLGFHACERALAAAYAAEDSVRRKRVTSIEFAIYCSIAHNKRRAFVPASVALAVRLNWDRRKQRLVEDMIDQLGIGLQLRRDVVEWPADQREGLAWPAMLGAEGFARAPVEELECWLHEEAILSRLLDVSSDAFARAAWAAKRLGLRPLARWARGQAEVSADLAARELKTMGTAIRWGHEARERLVARQRARDLGAPRIRGASDL